MRYGNYHHETGDTRGLGQRRVSFSGIVDIVPVSLSADGSFFVENLHKHTTGVEKMKFFT
jgi:hypothetical protein